MTKIIAKVRGHLEKLKKEESKKYTKKENVSLSPYAFVFDTETGVDLHQNLKVGFYAVYYNIDTLVECGFFYDSRNCEEKEVRILEKYCRKNNINILAHQEFIKTFYEWVLNRKALCLGFNLPFDLSRLASRYSFTKNKRFHNGFSLSLSESKILPNIRIKSCGKEFAFIEFTRRLPKCKDEQYLGRFLDLHTLALALSGEKSITLAKACTVFNTSDKKSSMDVHGKITKKYLDYSVQDVIATHSLWVRLTEELENYCIPILPEKIYSSASLGKTVLEMLGIHPFIEQNPDFPKEILGSIMVSFLGGRSEVVHRKNPVKVSVLDFTSMYPTVNILLGLMEFLTAESTEYKDDTENVQDFLDKVKLKDLQDPKIWPELCVLVEIIPDNEVLPVRTNFDENKRMPNIGICEVTSDVPMFYMLPELVASKILTGKIPKIKRAIRLIPKGVQSTLKKVTILGMNIDPGKENIFKRLVEERQRTKKERDKHEKNSQKHQELNNKQQGLKILTNAGSYGIFAEVNPEPHKSEVTVYSDTIFNAVEKYEKPGKYYNPLLASLITSASRLMLAMVESKLSEQGMSHAFCDTDGIAVPVKAVQLLQEFFKSLNPYNEKIQLLKVEYDNVWFFGISAKRYVLYKLQGKKITILKPSLHGLGHLLNPYGEKVQNWHSKIWTDFLKLHYKWISDQQFQEKYGNLYAVSFLTISTQHVYRRVKKYNKEKTFQEQIKPYNFIIFGFGQITNTGKKIKPIAPFNKNSQQAVEEPFIDSETGETMEGSEYWQNLASTLYDYLNHPESKLDGETGQLQRKKVHVMKTVTVGKEVKDIDEQLLDINLPTEYHNQVDIKEQILCVTPKQARKINVTRSALWKIKQKIKKGKKLNLKNKTIQQLIQQNLSEKVDNSEVDSRQNVTLPEKTQEVDTKNAITMP